MPELIGHIDATLAKYQAERIIVACSGGLDSTVLLYACSKLDIQVEIAHVNYQLRGEDSEKDQQFLEALTQQLGLAIHIKRVDLKSELEDGGNLQETARSIRYDFFSGLYWGEKNTYVLLAHHQEDQTETFFMNLSRQSGVMGLSAMPEKRGRYLRPLLSFSKEDLRLFAIKSNITWREDASNSSLKYTRNQWRNVLLPEVREAIPDLDNSVSLLVNLFQEKQRGLQSKILGIMNEIRLHESLAVATFKELDFLEVIELCRQMWQPPGIAETWGKLNHKGTGVDLKPSQKFDFNRIVFDGDQYTFLRSIPLPSPKLILEDVQRLPEEFNKEEVYLDSSKVHGELRLRSVRTGDRIHPIGMSGSKLVSDVISDAKFNASKKRRVRVLVDDLHVLWVPELCVSRKAVATSTSPQIIKARLESVLK